MGIGNKIGNRACADTHAINSIEILRHPVIWDEVILV